MAYHLPRTSKPAAIDNPTQRLVQVVGGGGYCAPPKSELSLGCHVLRPLLEAIKRLLLLRILEQVP